MRHLRFAFITSAILALTVPVGAQTTAVFTPPATWSQVPRGFMLTQFKNIWQSPKHGGIMFGEAVLPIPASLIGALLTQIPAKGTIRGARTVCGNRGSAVIFTGSKASPGVLEAEVFSKNGLTYAAVYGRRSNGKGDPAIEQTMRNICPAGDGGIAPATPPPGWSVFNNGLDLEFSGMWLGNSPLQIMTLVQGHAIPPPDQIASFLPSKTVRKGVQVEYAVQTRRVKFCGADGTTVSVKFGGNGFDLNYDLAATQANGVSYLLSYLHPSDYTDQSAAQALSTLCVQPSTPPTLPPSPAPSATP